MQLDHLNLCTNYKQYLHAQLAFLKGLPTSLYAPNYTDNCYYQASNADESVRKFIRQKEGEKDCWQLVGFFILPQTIASPGFEEYTSFPLSHI